MTELDEHPDVPIAAPPTEDPLSLLLVAAREGDRQPFCAFVESTSATVMTYIRRYGTPSDEADDLFQEVYLAVFKHLHTFDRSRAALPWLLVITRNTVARAHVDRAKHPNAVMETDPPLSTDDPHRTVEVREELRFLQQYMGSLPEDQREILALAATSSLTLNGMAAVMGIPEGSVRTNLYRGRAALARALAEWRSREVLP